MSAIVKCDACGKEASMVEYDGRFLKPREWYQRSDDDGIQVACSRACIDVVAKNSGKPNVILPW